MAKPKISLREKVEARLKELDRTPTEAARIGGLEESFLRDLLRNRKRSVHGTNLARLARGLDWAPSDLIEMPAYAVGTSPANLKSQDIFIIGEVSAGIWKDITSEQVDEPQGKALFPPDPRFPIAAQFDFIVSGTSMNNFAKPGQLLRCVALEAYFYQIENGDVVVVERRRGDLRERTAKRYHLIEPGKPELWPDSDDPHWSEPVKIGADKDTTTQIVAIVLWAYSAPTPWKRPARPS